MIIFFSLRNALGAEQQPRPSERRCFLILAALTSLRFSCCAKRCTVFFSFPSFVFFLRAPAILSRRHISLRVLGSFLPTSESPFKTSPGIFWAPFFSRHFGHGHLRHGFAGLRDRPRGGLFFAAGLKVGGALYCPRRPLGLSLPKLCWGSC